MSRIAREVAQLRAEFPRDAAKSLAEGQDNVSLRTEEIIKTQRRRALQRLTAPVDGTVQQLPAKCPELNRQENVWQFMRDNWL
jgi:hypothetical protein